jgi:hypothetical protein
MSDYNFQQGLRDLAQAAQLNAARRAAENTSNLLAVQRGQTEIQRQQFELDQLRFLEERARHESVQNKLERQKTLRNEMAEIERILKYFARDIIAGRLSQVLDGVSIISFLGAVIRRQLQMIVACKVELEDLSDIRFIGSLEESFTDLAAAHSCELAVPVLENATIKLGELARWAGSAGDRYTELEREIGKLLDSLHSSSDQQNSLNKITSNLELTEARQQELNEIEAFAARLWPGAQASLRALESFGVCSEQVALLTDIRFPLSLREFNANCDGLRGKLDEVKTILMNSNSIFNSDRLLFDICLSQIAQGNWKKAEEERNKIQRSDWADFDVGDIDNQLCVLREALAKKENNITITIVFVLGILIFVYCALLISK